ncbi:Fibronectin, type III [Echinococcus multilocularis]|uniref:Fibronectin, type III n=1 Tax=Echinococcus multilocularis TaxID=6211 RepID=A0A0S4MP26_ECHMU|nr:Fibronectin, type III [Echinococcus multilocularis]
MSETTVKRETPDTVVMLERIALGMLSCTVQAFTMVGSDLTKSGPVSPSIAMTVPSTVLPPAPPVSIQQVDETTFKFELQTSKKDEVLGAVVGMDQELNLSFYVQQAEGPIFTKKLIHMQQHQLMMQNFLRQGRNLKERLS